MVTNKLVLSSILIATLAAPVSASVVATFSQTADGVRTNIEGSLDLTDLGPKTDIDTAFAGNFFDAGTGSFSASNPSVAGGLFTAIDLYYVRGALTPFGPDNPNQLACNCTDLVSGDTIRIGTVNRRDRFGVSVPNITIGLPNDYQSGQSLSAQIFSDVPGLYAGMVAGTFVTELPGDQSITVIVEEPQLVLPAPVPLPASLWLLGAAVFGTFGLKKRAKQARG